MGTTATRTLLARFDGDTRGLNNAVNRAESDFKRFDRSADRASSKAHAGMQKFGRGVAGVTAIVGAATFGLAALGGALLSVGDDAVAMRTGVEKAKVVFGESFRRVEEAAKRTANQVGLTTREFKILGAGIADFLIPMGFARNTAADMTLKFLDLSGKLALWSAGTMTATDVAYVFQSAMAGEYDSLQRLGIGINAERVALEAAAIQKKSNKDLTDAQATAMAILKIATDDSADAQTFWNSEAGEQARKAQETKTKLRDLWQEIQNKLIPIYDRVWKLIDEKVLPKFQAFIDWLESPEGKKAIDDWSKRVEDLIGLFSDFIGKIQTVHGWLKSLDDFIDNVREDMPIVRLLRGENPFSTDAAWFATAGGTGFRSGGPAPNVNVAAPIVNVYFDGMQASIRTIVQDENSRQAWRARSGRR